MTFEGTDCRLADIGKLADATGGRVRRGTLHKQAICRTKGADRMNDEQNADLHPFTWRFFHSVNDWMPSFPQVFELRAARVSAWFIAAAGCYRGVTHLLDNL